LRRSGVDPLASDEELVESWRAERLIAAGYPDEVALALAADVDVELAVAEGLLEHGCPLRTALRILAPLPERK
jgi:hypothetical protein